MLMLAFPLHTAYRFQLAGYRDEKDYISIQKVDSVRERTTILHLIACSALSISSQHMMTRYARHRSATWPAF